jgi:thiamine biosynthesis lipoprotein ApbE
MHEWYLELEATGTVWRIEYTSEHEQYTEVKSCISAFESEFSRFIPTSALSILNTTGKLNNPSDEMQEILELCEKYNQLTGGKFDARVGGVLSARGYGMSAPTPYLDFGGIGKGYLADKVANLLEESGAKDIVVNAGGDIRVISTKPVELYLEHPTEAKTYIGKVEIQNGALASSSPHKRKWKSTSDPKLSTTHQHLINPLTGDDQNYLYDAIFVTAPSSTLADVATKAIFASTSDIEIQSTCGKLGVEFLCYSLVTKTTFRSAGFEHTEI